MQQYRSIIVKLKEEFIKSEQSRASEDVLSRKNSSSKQDYQDNTSELDELRTQVFIINCHA